MNLPTDPNCYLIGPHGVGKTSLLVRFNQGGFIEEYEPTVDDSWRKNLEINGEQFWINCLEVSFDWWESLLPKVDHQAVCFLFAFSLTDENSFYQLEKTLKDYSASKGKPLAELFPKSIIVGCKLTRSNQISHDECQSLADELSGLYMDTSAETGEGVTEVFIRAVQILREQIKVDDLRESKSAASRNCALQ